MFSFLKWFRSAPKARAPSDEWTRLRNEFADPYLELASTKQALLVSSVSVLDRIWNANGGLGWDAEGDIDYLETIREHLIDSRTFTDEECATIRSAIDEIRDVGDENAKRMERAGDRETTLLQPGDSVDVLIESVIVWCRRHPEPIAVREEDGYIGHD